MAEISNKKKYVLKNNYLTLTVKKNGAEMVSLKKDNTEYVWQANTQFWARHAPILFPIVGRLIDNEYLYKGQHYSMNQHGFARDSDFEVIDKTDNSICLELSSTEKLKKIYPFNFKLQVAYTLEDRSLRTEYTIINPSKNDDLYFSIGAHPAFNCPFEKGHSRNEYQLIFDKQLAPESDVIEDGLRCTKTSKVFEEKGLLTIHNSLFDNDAIIFNPNPFSKVTFVHKPSQKAYMSVSFTNYPYLGIWSSNQDAPFVCIEPWHGITDHKDHNKELPQKEGVIKLVANEKFSCEFTVEVL
ncbi:aldose 1-epimerase family protein [Aureibaculum sp. A20]|uniref:Aldose 1-epimerase family protein n=1 Tax=Aureibaculum flavum TaxID=2795986 RepID=A0ABS0WTU7_9FLAO|nr:aldose 1-epimerase family protein [Aureibaculum flavum]MBJ2175404.1 aldose 1-epimerase family protein [Aureibaculum flavum]